MKRLANGTATFVLMLVLGSMFLAAAAQAKLVRGQPPSYYKKQQSNTEFILEGGLADPMGDLKDELYLVSEDPMANVKGLGQGTGYELGLRIRHYLGDFFAVSPAFHYIRMGAAEGVMDYQGSENLAYNVRSTVYKYGLDFHAFSGGPKSSFRPFLTGGVALAHNVYRDELQYKGVYTTSINAPAFSGGLGIKMKNIELVGEYTYNRFDTPNLPPDEGTMSYNWDFLVVRMAISFGR